jgi:hypothetical protein
MIWLFPLRAWSELNLALVEATLQFLDYQEAKDREGR